MALYLQNVPQYVIALLAVWKLGGIVVAVNPMLTPGEVAKLLADSTPEVLLTLDELHFLNPVFDETFHNCLEPASVLAIHDVVGGTAPARVRQGLAAAKRKIESLREEVNLHAHA